MVVSASYEWRTPPTLGAFRQDWKRAAPPDSLLQLYLSRAANSPLEACPSLTRILDRRGVAYGPQAESRRQRESGAAGGAADALIVSLPAVSEDGQEAIVDIGRTCPGLCGYGMFVYFRRDGQGQWQRAGYSRGWIS